MKNNFREKPQNETNKVTERIPGLPKSQICFDLDIHNEEEFKIVIKNIKKLQRRMNKIIKRRVGKPKSYIWFDSEENNKLRFQVEIKKKKDQNMQYYSGKSVIRNDGIVEIILENNSCGKDFQTSEVIKLYC